MKLHSVLSLIGFVALGVTGYWIGCWLQADVSIMKRIGMGLAIGGCYILGYVEGLCKEANT